jgi:hypothetical protein
VWPVSVSGKSVHRNRPRICALMLRLLLLYGSGYFFSTGAAAQATGKKTNSAVAIFEDLLIDDPATNSILRRGEDSAQKINHNIFITAGASKQRCYLGEPILLTHTLYTALQSTSRIVQAPGMEGFSTQLITPPNESVVRTRRGHKIFRVFILQQQVAVPLQQGELLVNPLVVQNDISYTIAGRSKQHYSGRVAGGTSRIYVDTLPVAGQPPAFLGAIGQFSIAVWVNTDAGRSSPALHIDIEGKGNFASVEMPAISWPTGFEPLTPVVQDTLQKNVFPPTGKRSFIIPFIAGRQAVLEMKSLSFPFFDPDKKKYTIASAKPVYTVLKGALPDRPPARKQQAVISRSGALLYYVLALAALAGVMAVIFLIVRRKKKPGTRH